MNKVLNKIELAVNAVDDIPEDTRQKVIASAVDAFAPKAWLKSTTVRWGATSVAGGILGMVMTYFGDGNPDLIVGSIVSIIAGVGAIRGRANAEQPIDTKKVV